MPTYTLRNKKTLETRQEFLTISEMEKLEKKLKKQDPNWEVACGAPILGFNVYNVKTDDGFKDLLKSIKKANPGSSIEPK